MYVLERFDDATQRGAKIYGELVGYAMNSDASDFVLPNPAEQARCMSMAIRQAQLNPEDIDIVSTHATATTSGDVQECVALRQVFHNGAQPMVNNTKSFIGHAMGAAGALELAGNLPSLSDGVCHPTINVERLDPECALPGLAINEPRVRQSVRYILNNSFGMLGINSVVIVGKV
jgi:3-oxoacyl-[acyl-carrier-protein] synthase II